MKHCFRSKKFVPLIFPPIVALLVAFGLAPDENQQTSPSSNSSPAVAENDAAPVDLRGLPSGPQTGNLRTFEISRPPHEMAKGSTWPITFPDGTTVTARVKASERDGLNQPLYYATGDLSGAGTFYLGKNDALNDSDGWFLLYDQPMAWRGKVNAAGNWQLDQTPVGNLICLPFG